MPGGDFGEGDDTTEENDNHEQPGMGDAHEPPTICERIEDAITNIIDAGMGLPTKD